MKATAAIPVLLVIALTGSAIAQDREAGSIPEKMKLNLEKMDAMLSHLLLDERWDAIIEDAGLLMKHAQVIRALDPSEYSDEMPKSDYFESYALHLESSSNNLKVVTEEIERERAAGGQRSEHLRPNAAVFFGQAVTMCVNCHNQFRKR
jgi:hypothetical protein